MWIWRIAAVLSMLVGLLAFGPSGPVQAAGTVGDGTPGSCTDAALDTALAGGGLVTFDCGPNPITISVTSEKSISADTQIDGGELITIDGQNSVRIFAVNVGVTLDLENITLSNGNSTDSGGGIFNAGTLTLTNSTLSGNSTTVGGGGIYNQVGTVTITSSTFSGNSAPFGGGIFNFEGIVTLTNSTVSGASTGIFGGGIYNNDGTVTLTNSTVSGNSADFGGGIYNSNNMLTLINSTVSGNSAIAAGGIYNSDGTVTITNSTVSGNSATIGGGIANEVGMVTITNSTISDNSADFGGGLINEPGTAILQNTIIANSTSGGNCNGDPVTSQGGNLSDDDTCLLNQPSDLPDTDDNLGPLADNGGPTLTHLPQEGSAAIDNGLGGPCPETDQRGVARPQGAACDIGSVEVTGGPTYSLCVSYYTGAVTSPQFGTCGAGTVAVEPYGQTFCINAWTGQLTFSASGACTPPRFAHTMPDDGDLLTCVSLYTGANRWVWSHAQCTAYELPNTIPATP